MSIIVKTCKHHGDLTEDLVFIYARKDRKEGDKKIFCRLCKLEKDARYRSKNREKLSKASMQWKRENRDHVNEWQRKDREKDPEKYNSAKREWRAKNEDKVHINHVKHIYGVDSSQYASILASQNNLCAICNKPETKASRTPGKICRLAIDHCHETGKIRGLLCHGCNTAIGKFLDDIQLLESAISYLRRNSET